MLNRLDLRGVDDFVGRLPRPVVDEDGPVQAVRQILSDVRERGDEALLELTAKFDGVDLESIRVSPDVIQGALDSLPPEVRQAMETARDRIADHHRAQLTPPVQHSSDGISISSSRRPVDRVGCYVPGGRAEYPSTVLMTAVPALVAGVSEVALCVPPDRTTGSVPVSTLAAAALAGVTEVYSVGGAQAIGALAFGTHSVAPVDVICGPGNKYVAIAKQEVAGKVGIAAAFAGPSEVVVIADATTDPRLAAVDVILQAEHGPDGLAWLITWDEAFADAVVAEITTMVEASPRSEDIAATFAEGGYVALVDSPEAALAVSDLIAPEHLELMCKGAEQMAQVVRNAGAIFVGQWSPASIGDYVAGPSHVLPTHGSARFASALTVDDFLKHHHIIEVSPSSYIQGVAENAAVLADTEGLAAHAESIRLRQRILQQGENRNGESK
ncbi:MAG: histidinol dehydrogenase [Microthrixaceae bacterium]|nr:histidinol dehydrogenase [Microthrixaceae bacterium]